MIHTGTTDRLVIAHGLLGLFLRSNRRGDEQGESKDTEEIEGSHPRRARRDCPSPRKAIHFEENVVGRFRKDVDASVDVSPLRLNNANALSRRDSCGVYGNGKAGTEQRVPK